MLATVTDRLTPNRLDGSLYLCLALEGALAVVHHLLPVDALIYAVLGVIAVQGILALQLGSHPQATLSQRRFSGPLGAWLLLLAVLGLAALLTPAG